MLEKIGVDEEGFRVAWVGTVVSGRTGRFQAVLQHGGAAEEDVGAARVHAAKEGEPAGCRGVRKTEGKERISAVCMVS